MRQRKLERSNQWHQCRVCSQTCLQTFLNTFRAKKYRVFVRFFKLELNFPWKFKKKTTFSPILSKAYTWLERIQVFTSRLVENSTATEYSTSPEISIKKTSLLAFKTHRKERLKSQKLTSAVTTSSRF